jgi:hypothetical protein
MSAASDILHDFAGIDRGADPFYSGKSIWIDCSM